jgi:hypothetical protein
MSLTVHYLHLLGRFLFTQVMEKWLIETGTYTNGFATLGIKVSFIKVNFSQ